MKKRTILGVHPQIFIMGIVSFLTDISSEMIFSVLSVFLSVILGASAFVIGLIEGMADFASSSLDYISGYFSDKTGKRKVFAVMGYGFSALAKVVLVFANTVAAVGVFRVTERLGKSFRDSPRDAMISTISKKSRVGFSFGFHKMLDKAGAVLGPVAAYFVLDMFGQSAWSFRMLFIAALVPAVIAVIAMMIFVKDKPVKKRPSMRFFAVYKTLGDEYKHYLKTAGIFSVAYFSFAFLLLKAYAVGFQIKDVALLYALFNLAFVAFAVPAGRIGDAIGRRWVILSEYAIYAVMSVGLIIASSKSAVIAMFILYGIFFAIDESQSKAYVSELSDRKSRASAIGIYSFVTGLVYIPASLIAGFLWSYLGSGYAFGFAALVAVAAGVYFIAYKYKKSSSWNLLKPLQ